MASPLRMPFKRDNLDKLLRIRRAELRYLFPSKDDAPLREKLAAVVDDGKQATIWDEKQTGLCVLVSRGRDHKADATVTFRVAYYLESRPGAPIYKQLGRYPDEIADIDKARDLASAIRINAKSGVDPKRRVASHAFADVAATFIEDYAKSNRSGGETEKIFNRYILPEWGELSINDIDRDTVTALLDKVEKRKIKRGERRMGGVSNAKATYAALSTLFNWQETRSGTFKSPLVKRMKKMRGWKTQRRGRYLNDDELRIMWPLLSDLGPYGAAVKFALLSAQRFYKVADMRRADVKDRMRIASDRSGDVSIGDVWDPTREDDPENKLVSIVPLAPLSRQVIESVPIIDEDGAGGWVFTFTGLGPIKGWSRCKERLDRLMLAAMKREAGEGGRDPKTIQLEPWQHRDLRRTARTLMSRAGVSTEIAEHCLGHVLPSIQRTYNRYDYAHEKQEAFAKLAALVERIIGAPQATP